MLDMNNVLKVTPEQGEYEVTLQDVTKADLHDNDMISTFMKIIIKIKTDINIARAKISCKEANEKFDKSKVEIGKYQIHAAVLTSALKLFIKWYDETCQEGTLAFIDRELLKRKDELYFLNFAVDFSSLNDCDKAEEIIDALCVKFYQTVIYLLNLHFGSNSKVFIIQASEAKNAYKFSFRKMNLMELNDMRNGKVPINLVK